MLEFKRKVLDAKVLSVQYPKIRKVEVDEMFIGGQEEKKGKES